MVDVVLSTDELTVLGGPAEIALDVDFGPEGDRGSLIFVGTGKPSGFTLPAGVESLKVFDIYINALPSDSEYQFLYQYLPTDGGSANWTKIVKISSTSYSYNHPVLFTAGQSEDIVINLSSFLPPDLLGQYSASSFNIQANVLGQNPVSLGLTVSEILPGSPQALPIKINAIEYASGSWQPVAGTRTVHLFITLKNNIS